MSTDFGPVLQQAVQQVHQRWSVTPEVAIILGTGLGAFVESMQVDQVFPYSSLPGFTKTTAVGHVGELVCGWLADIPILAFRGRSHCYEGATAEQVTVPARFAAASGARTLVVSCAAGGLSPRFQAGELMLIDDQVDFLFCPQSGDLRRNRPLMMNVYDRQLKESAITLARELNIPLQIGTYVSVAGPNYETRAEMRFYRQFADAIGMSTVLESAVAQQLGMRVVGLATITNLCNPDALTIADGDHVVCVATQTEPAFRRLTHALIRQSLRPSQSPRVVDIE